MSLIQLIYVSTATEKMPAEEFRRILDTSVRRNSASQVTGMLLYAHGSFMQVLEGEAAAVEETLGRILRDPRHDDLTVLTRQPVEARDFATWSMGFRGVSAEDAAAWPGYAPFFALGFKAEQIGARPGLALEILKTFAELN